MTSATVVVHRLRQIEALTDLVGPRIYQLTLGERPTYPAVLVQLVDEFQGHHQRGRNDLVRGRVQVDVFERDSGTGWMGRAEALTDAVYGDGLGDAASGLSGWRGLVGGSPPTAEVVALFRVDVDQLYEAGDLRLVRIRQDYMVHWRRLM